jgi:site-specific DNA-adenine methylase
MTDIMDIVNQLAASNSPKPFSDEDKTIIAKISAEIIGNTSIRFPLDFCHQAYLMSAKTLEIGSNGKSHEEQQTELAEYMKTIDGNRLVVHKPNSSDVDLLDLLRQKLADIAKAGLTKQQEVKSESNGPDGQEQQTSQGITPQSR